MICFTRIKLIEIIGTLIRYLSPFHMKSSNIIQYTRKNMLNILFTCLFLIRLRKKYQYIFQLKLRGLIQLKVIISLKINYREFLYFFFIKKIVFVPQPYEVIRKVPHIIGKLFNNSLFQYLNCNIFLKHRKTCASSSYS